ncbi:hypothetical protein I3J27_32490 [Bradyrhizobium xenonodulans]|uniref:Uncharacterized protein n=1 Tax=Bradyrhizobium xenonodulans TaxID=2736875 RepID=A0ABY7MJF0_9BRAD|nr:hypothetical protein [Bradyrhizobium xenonodulans]WBL77688.1 hypothetical protein I3J27_32490 [Bradyrhizobium xenonodulans]
MKRSPEELRNNQGVAQWKSSWDVAPGSFSPASWLRATGQCGDKEPQRVSLLLKLIEPDPRHSLLKRALSHGSQAFGLVNNNLWYRLPNRALQSAFPDDSIPEAALRDPRAVKRERCPATAIKSIIAYVSAPLSPTSNETRQCDDPLGFGCSA